MAGSVFRLTGASLTGLAHNMGATKMARVFRLGSHGSLESNQKGDLTKDTPQDKGASGWGKGWEGVPAQEPMVVFRPWTMELLVLCWAINILFQGTLN